MDTSKWGALRHLNTGELLRVGYPYTAPVTATKLYPRPASLPDLHIYWCVRTTSCCRLSHHDFHPCGQDGIPGDAYTSSLYCFCCKALSSLCALCHPPYITENDQQSWSEKSPLENLITPAENIYPLQPGTRRHYLKISSIQLFIYIGLDIPPYSKVWIPASIRHTLCSLMDWFNPERIDGVPSIHSSWEEDPQIKKSSLLSHAGLALSDGNPATSCTVLIVCCVFEKTATNKRESFHTR